MSNEILNMFDSMQAQEDKRTRALAAEVDAILAAMDLKPVQGPGIPDQNLFILKKDDLVHFLRTRQHLESERNIKADELVSRMKEINTIIDHISSHGRRFFYSVNSGIVEHFDLDECQLVWVGWNGTIKAPELNGFTHGGTLRTLVEGFAQYILKGTPIPDWQINAHRIENVWGYDEASAAELSYILQGFPCFRAPVYTPNKGARP